MANSTFLHSVLWQRWRLPMCARMPPPCSKMEQLNANP